MRILDTIEAIAFLACGIALAVTAIAHTIFYFIAYFKGRIKLWGLDALKDGWSCTPIIFYKLPLYSFVAFIGVMIVSHLIKRLLHGI